MRPFDGHFDFLRHHKTSCVPEFWWGTQEVFPFAENKKNLTSEEGAVKIYAQNYLQTPAE